MNEKLLGYEIEDRNNKTDITRPAYILTGTRGARYSLYRYNNHPNHMYVVNGSMNIVGLKGNYTFTDKNGELDVANPWFE